MMIFSIVRITEPGAICSYPVGRFEVYFTESEHVANETCGVFNRCRYADNLGFSYAVEYVGEESPDRAPESTRRVDAVCVPNVVFA